MTVDERLHPPNEPEMILVRSRVGLVPADVEIGAGRPRRDLAQHVVEESIRVRLPDAQRAEPTSMPV